LFLSGCSGGAGPAATSGAGGNGGANGGGNGGANAGNGGGGGAGAGSTSGGASASGTITGTIIVHAKKHTEDPTIQGVVDDAFDATITLKLKRDPSSAEELYVDNGSSYEVDALSTTSRLIGDCTGTSETEAKATHKFADQPTSIPNSIEARVNRGDKSVMFSASYSWVYSVSANSCDGRQPFTGENAAVFACPIFGLTAKLIEGNGTDQIDPICMMSGGEAYGGTITLTR
jgi:hypothetical protein